jgi:hypothetical protein
MSEAHLCKVKKRDAQVMHRPRGDWKVTDARGKQPVLLMVLTLADNRCCNTDDTDSGSDGS